jgi:hypothetical protein
MDLEKSARQTDSTALAVERALGTRPDVGFRSENGALSTVTVSFDYSENVSRLTVGQLEDGVRPAVRGGFQGEPEEVIKVKRTAQ